jgi:4,5-DOPA dioxygenase extradiol
MSPNRQPVIFFGHGSPIYAITANRWTQTWKTLATQFPRPKAILSVSAHWYTRGVGVTAMKAPKTIHDFGGFPQALFEVQYPAPGSPELARRVQQLLQPRQVQLDEDQWGLDHGTWSVLVHAYPEADIPVVQLSIDGTQPGAFHYAIGQALKPLRDEGVLVIGSGDVVHNLRMMQRQDAPAFDWAERFEAKAIELISKGEHGPLIDYPSLGRDAMLSIPTPDHYFPMLYVLGMQEPGEPVSFPTQGIDIASVSMLSVAIGLPH